MCNLGHALTCSLQIRMDLKHLKTKNQKAAAKHPTETDNLQVGPAGVPQKCLYDSSTETTS